MQQIAGQRPGFNPWVGKIPGEENGSPLQDSCLESPQNREAWQTTICGVAKSQTRLSIMCQINHKLILNNIFLLLNSLFSSVRCCCFHSVAKSCAILGDPMDCSRPGFPSFTISLSLLKLMSIELVMPPNHLILCHLLLLLSSIFPSIRVFSIDSALHVRWPKY